MTRTRTTIQGPSASATLGLLLILVFAGATVHAAQPDGRVVVAMSTLAVHWYRRGAEQGDADAQFNLGVMYAEGEGVARDDAEARRWYRKAAEQGHADAQHNLRVWGLG